MLFRSQIREQGTLPEEDAMVEAVLAVKRDFLASRGTAAATGTGTPDPDAEALGEAASDKTLATE